MRTRTLVTYYSRTGYTRRVAETIAAALHADTDEIRDARAPDGRMSLWRAMWNALRRVPSPIAEPGRLPATYDLVVVCGPVWAGRMASPIRAYLTSYGAALDEAAFVVTQGGSGGDNVLHDMHVLAGCQPVAALAITDQEIDRDGAANARLCGFIDTLRAHLMPVPAEPARRLAPGPEVAGAPARSAPGVVA